MEMKKSDTQLSVFLKVLRGAIWSIYTGIFSSLYGLFALVRDEFLPTDVAEKLRLGGIFNKIDWYWWVIAGLFIFWIGAAWESAKTILKITKENLIEKQEENIITRAENSSQAVSVSNSPNASINLNSKSDNSTQPSILLGLIDENGAFSQKFTLHLNLLPERPDIEKLVEEKRAMLLGKKKKVTSPQNDKASQDPGKNLEIAFSTISTSVASLMMASSLNGYEKRVEEYLLKYKNYLEDAYIYPFIENRYIQLMPVAENRSSTPASLVKIEVYIPDALSFPTKNLMHLKRMQEFGYEDFLGKEPEEPELYDFAIPSVPLYLNSFQNPPPSRHKPDIGNLFIEERHDKLVVEYEIENLIPSYSEKLDFISIWTETINESAKWVVPVKIYAKELKIPIESQLEINFVVAKNQE